MDCISGCLRQGQVFCSFVSRHPSLLVPSWFSCPVPLIPVREWVRREWKGRKSLKLCILRLKVPVNVKKLKEIAMKSQFWVLLLHFPSYFSLFWAVSSVLRCLESRLDPSRFCELSPDLSRPAKNLSRHNTSILQHWLPSFIEIVGVPQKTVKKASRQKFWQERPYP